MCGLKNRAESKVIARQRTCSTGKSVEPLTVMDHQYRGGTESYGILSCPRPMESITAEVLGGRGHCIK